LTIEQILSFPKEYFPSGFMFLYSNTFRRLIQAVFDEFYMFVGLEWQIQSVFG